MKAIILLDFDSLNEAVQKLNVQIEMDEFLGFLESIHKDCETQTAYAYVGINQKLPHVKDRTIDELARAGYIVRPVVGDNYGINFIADFSQAITLDALRSVYENNATNVVLVSNSHKLENLVTLLREKDVAVVNVFYGSLVDYDLAVKSTGFINLDDYIGDNEDIIDQDCTDDGIGDNQSDKDFEDDGLECNIENENLKSDVNDKEQNDDASLVHMKVNELDFITKENNNKGENE